MMAQKNSKQSLKDAWKQFQKTLDKRGEVLPNDDTGAIHWDSEKGAAQRLLYTDNLDKVPYTDAVVREQSTWDSRSNEEKVSALRERYSGWLTSAEMDVICDRFVYNSTFKIIAEQRRYVGGASSVHKVYKRALAKLEKRLKREKSKTDK